MWQLVYRQLYGLTLARRKEMKVTRFFSATIGAAIVGLCFIAPNTSAAADSKGEIEALERKCAQAPTADQFMTGYTPSDDLVVYDIGKPREFDGQQAVRADFQKFFDQTKVAKVE